MSVGLMVYLLKAVAVILKGNNKIIRANCTIELHLIGANWLLTNSLTCIVTLFVTA